MHRLRALTWLACLPLMAASASVRAQATKATIVQIDGAEVVIDLGKKDVTPAQALIVYRTLEVRHPITHKLLRDRFAIGELRVLQPGESLSVATLSSAPTHPLQVGDAVELDRPVVTAPVMVAASSPAASVAAGSAAQAPAPAATSAVPPSTAATSESALQRELLSYWYASLSQAPEKRARLYQAYLQRHPDSPYREFVQNEVLYLQTLDARLAHPSASAAPAAREPAALPSLEMLPISGASAGQDVEVAVRVRGAKPLRGLVLHVRALEDEAYSTLAMPIDARGHARVLVPRKLVRAPGFAFFIESVDVDGQASLALASARAPKLAIVRGPEPKTKPHERATRVRFSSELVSFDGASGRDYYFVNEGDFLYRVQRGPLYGLRMGYGNLRGEGGTVEQLDVDHLAPQPAGFSYGFFEAELELDRLFGLAARGTVGLGRPDDDLSQRNGITGGFQLRARIGEAEGTHLVLAGEAMPEIGQRAYIGLAWEAIERVPMSTEIVVTDQPVNSDELAVRLIYEIGYRFSDRVSIALRPSYQLRTIRHAGPGIGMAATFDF